MIKPAVLDAMVAAGCTAQQIAAAVKADQADEASRPRRISAWDRVRFAIFERDAYRCTYCGCDASEDPQCDHVHPVSQGGSSDQSNLTTACRVCNSSKAGDTVVQWRARR